MSVQYVFQCFSHPQVAKKESDVEKGIILFLYYYIDYIENNVLQLL